MFNHLTNNSHKKNHWYRFGERLPVQTAAALLADKRYRFYIEQVKELAGLPEDHFNHFYQAFIYRFAEFVQVIPDDPNSPLGSFITNGLLRGLNTLHQFVTQFEKPSPLERYALFTACVLRDISHIITGQKIYITDDKGATIKLWQPFCGPLTEETEGKSYKIFPMAQIYNRIGKSLRVTLARQVMGENGFLWIASDIRLFAEWIDALIEEDEEGSGRLVKVIRVYRRSGGGIIDNLPHTETDILDSPATKHADAFYDWLLNGLQDGSISTNTSDSNVHITDVGVFLQTPGIFDDFARLYQGGGYRFVVPTQFGNLIGITSKGGGDYMHAALFSDYPDGSGLGKASRSTGLLSSKSHAMREGIMIADKNSLYINGKAPDTTPYIKIPASMKQAHQELAQFNAVTRPNNALKNR